jgi:hypothetical protein
MTPRLRSTVGAATGDVVDSNAKVAVHSRCCNWCGMLDVVDNNAQMAVHSGSRTWRSMLDVVDSNARVAVHSGSRNWRSMLDVVDNSIKVAVHSGSRNCRKFGRILECREQQRRRFCATLWAPRKEPPPLRSVGAGGSARDIINHPRHTDSRCWMLLLLISASPLCAI